MRLRFLTIATVVACGLAAFGQNTGRLSGTVLDASGAAIPGATVNLYLSGGNSPIQSVKSGQDGGYFFASLQPVQYDLSVEMSGFRKEIIRGLKVDPGLELSMKAITLEVSQQVETIEVTADVAGVQISNAEVATTITNSQVRRLPVLNRSPLGLISTQAGIGSNSRTSTTINGMRPSFTNISIDGVNIQDNFIRTNALDYLPNLLLLDQVAEFTVSTSNTNAGLGNGAAQVTFVTPSGTNELHGAAYWYNRNNIVSANTWFNNKNGASRPFLNQNQLGGSLGGPVIKDKLFFYTNYEAFRLRQQAPQTRTILTDTARAGIFRYRDTAGNLQLANLLQIAGIQPDSVTRGLIAQLPTTINRTDIGDGLNTGGYAFNMRDNRTRDNVTAKTDYVISMRHRLSGTYLWNRDIDDRPDAEASGYTTAPAVRNENNTNLVSVTWSFVPTSSLTNEFRGGFNLAPGDFLSSENLGSVALTLPLISSPVNTFRPQGRTTNTYNLQDNATWIKGRHTIAFGGQYQRITTDSYTSFDVIPSYTLGMSAGNSLALTGAQLPGIRSQDLTNANALLALTGGFLTSGVQRFNVTSRTSGYVPLAELRRFFELQNLAFYVNDTWRVNRRLTVTAGLRWEFYTPVTERDSLALLPVLQNNNPIQTLLSPAGTLDFAGASAGRPWYNKDWNNFGPNVGVSWQPFNDNGKTVIRAGYSVNFPNDEFIRALDNSTSTNAGLEASRSITNLTSRVGAGVPAISAPAFQVPRTYAQNFANDPAANALALPDPNLRTPYVQQWSFGLQRELFGGILEGRYVGNRAVKQFRAFDYNQIQVLNTPFLNDFINARRNGEIARAATGVFNPVYNPNLPGSAPLPVFAAMPSGGLLTNGTVRGLIETGEAAGLGHVYVTNGLNGPVQFYTNTNAYGTNLMTNYSAANYHGLQIDFRRSFQKGFQFQANYTMAKSLSDAAGDTQQRFEAFLDLNNAAIEYSPTPFDLRHAFKANGVWELPFGKGKPFAVDNAIVDHVIGGWSLSGFLTWQSGSPFSILSARNTLNRTGRSANNTATTPLDGAQLDEIVGFYMTGNGPYMISRSAIDPATGRGTAADGRAAFNGQAFYNPGPGQIGSLQRRMFYGPRFLSADLALLKNFQIAEKQRLEFRSEWFNFSNSPSFYIGDQNINSTTFGRITSTASARRVIQFGLYYRF